MKILMCNAFYYERGGSESYTFALTAEFVKRGHEVVPFSMKHERNLPSEYEKFFVSNVDFTAFAGGFKWARKISSAGRVLYSVEARRRVASLIEATKPDIAHVHNIAHHLSPSILPVIKAHGIPIVQTLHDYKLICPNTLLFFGGHTCVRCKGGKYYRSVLSRCKKNSVLASALAALELHVHRLLRIYEKNVDVFICSSRFLRDTMIDFGIDQRKLVHIPNFVDVEAYAPAPTRQDHIVYFGRLSLEKGVDTLIDAVRELPGATLYITGEGPQRAELEALAEGADNVKFVGHVEQRVLRELVGGAMFVVIPSLCYENAPMSVYEAFALGVAVVGSRIGGIPELIKDGETGLLFHPGDSEDLRDKIQSMLADKPRAIAMGAKARQRAGNEFGAARHYDAVMRVYRGLLLRQNPS